MFKIGVTAAAAYTALAVAETWPLAARLPSALPHDPYDPALVTWILWWNAHAVPYTARWWNAPMFWPMPGALALSEHLLGISILTSPLQWLGLAPATAYNVAFLASFPLAALAFHALAFALTGRHGAASIGAIAFAFGPYRLAQAAHLQMLWTFALPVALLALYRYLDTRRTRWLALFAIAWCVQGLSNGYLLLFFPVLLGLWAAWHVRDTRDLAAIALAGFAGSLPLLPILVQYQRWHTALALSRPLYEIQADSADILSIVSTGDTAKLWRGLSRFAHVEDQFFPGVVVLLLVAAGIVAAIINAPRAKQSILARRVRLVLLCAAIAAAVAALSTVAIGPWAITAGRRLTLVSASAPDKPLTIALLLGAIYTLSGPRAIAAWRRASPFAFFVVSAAVMFTLALGPTPRLAGRPVLFHSLYWWLLQIPVYSAVRVPARFGALFELCLAVAASLAFARLTASLHRRTQIAIAGVIVAVVAIEGWPEIPVVPVPPAWSFAPADGSHAALLELPLGSVEGDSAALWHSMQHRLPIVNGYSGYVPVHYGLLRLGLEMDDAHVLDPLARERDLIVAIDRREQARWSAIVSQHPRASHVGDAAAWVVYRISREPLPADPPPSQRLRIAAVRATSPEDVEKLIDGDPRTTWRSRRRDAGDEEVELDFGREYDVAALTLELGGRWFEFPRTLAVDCADLAGAWQSCWRGSTAALALDGALADARNPTMMLRIDAPRVARIRLRGPTAKVPWSIAELTAFSR
jgi:hypothetical protein